MKLTSTNKYLKPWIFGIIAGILVVLPGVLLPLRFPASYSFCLSGHSRDLVNGIINWFSGLYLPQTYISRKILLLSSPAVIAGAFTSAMIFRERRKIKASRPIISFLLGSAVMLIGIVIFGCPTRLIIRAGFGDVYGIAAALAMFIGVALAAIFLKLRWRLSK